MFANELLRWQVALAPLPLHSGAALSTPVVGQLQAGDAVAVMEQQQCGGHVRVRVTVPQLGVGWATLRDPKGRALMEPTTVMTARYTVQTASQRGGVG